MANSYLHRNTEEQLLPCFQPYISERVLSTSDSLEHGELTLFSHHLILCSLSLDD